MNWYKKAQLQKAKGKISPTPEWQREDSDAIEKEIYPGVYEQPKGKDYTDIGHDIMSFIAIMWFIDTDYKLHTLNLSEGDYEEEIDSDWMTHSHWKEFNNYSKKILASGRYEGIPDDPNQSKLSLVFHKSDRFHPKTEFIDSRRIYDILRENFPQGTRIQVYEDM